PFEVDAVRRLALRVSPRELYPAAPVAVGRILALRSVRLDDGGFERLWAAARDLGLTDAGVGSACGAFDDRGLRCLGQACAAGDVRRRFGWDRRRERLARSFRELPFRPQSAARTSEHPQGRPTAGASATPHG